MAPLANNTDTSLDYISLISALGSWLQPALYIVLGAVGAYIMKRVRKASGTPEPSPIDVQILEALQAQKEQQLQALRKEQRAQRKGQRAQLDA
jgi:hypothetical protein